MGEFSGSVENGRFRGQISIWVGVAAGVAVGSFALPIFDYVTGGDGNTNTYDPDKLVSVEFFPETDLRCEGLVPENSDEVLVSTITCEAVVEE